MAVRADFDLKNALIKTFTVKTGGATTAGKPVKFGATDLEIDTAAAADTVVIGVALETKAAGAQCQVCLSGTVLAAVIVGTGGATRGTNLKYVADGVTDTASGSDVIVGRAYQSGVVGDLIGMIVGGGK